MPSFKGKQNYQTLTNDDEVCIPSLSSILLAVSAANLEEQSPHHWPPGSEGPGGEDGGGRLGDASSPLPSIISWL